MRLSVWQDKPGWGDPEPWNGQSPGADLVMGKGFRTSDWLGGFTGGKRKKIQEGTAEAWS